MNHEQRTLSIGRVRPIIALFALAAFGSCGKPPAPSNISMDVGRPALNWVNELVGTPTLTFTSSRLEAQNCLGYVDSVTTEPGDSALIIEGWSWSREVGSSYQKFVVAGTNGTIIGGGETGIERMDVTRAFPGSIHQTRVGFRATVPFASDVDFLIGFNDDSSEFCLLDVQNLATSE